MTAAVVVVGTGACVVVLCVVTSTVVYSIPLREAQNLAAASARTELGSDERLWITVRTDN